VTGLTKRYRAWFRGDALAVDEVGFQVEAGEVLALVGPNGAGKTTTLLCVLGLLRPDGGTIRVFGEPATSRAAHARLGFLSEIFYTYPYRRADDLLRFYGRLSGMSDAALAIRIPELLDRVGLGDAAHRRVERFSKGMVQRLGLAQALLHEPDLLVLDEPTTGLDPEGRRMVADIVAEARRRGAAIVLSSHILSDVERVCDRIVMLRRGKVVLEDQVANVTAERSLEEVYMELVEGSSDG
jgi:ABC-2 type transport system ATP-binding protein